MSTKFRETAQWFADLSRNASAVQRAYIKADKLSLKASKMTKRAMEASREANLLAEQVLGGRTTTTEPVKETDSFEEMLPQVVTDDANHQRLWAEWFASIQREVDEEIASKDGTNED